MSRSYTASKLRNQVFGYDSYNDNDPITIAKDQLWVDFCEDSFGNLNIVNIGVRGTTNSDGEFRWVTIGSFIGGVGIEKLDDLITVLQYARLKLKERDS